MRGILDKGMNNRGQVIIINIIFLVLTIVIFVAMIPVLKESIGDATNYDSLNCASNNDCATDPTEPCYNSSFPSDTLSCSMIALYIPYIVIVILLVAVAKLMANRVDTFFAAGVSGQPAYPSY